MSQRIQEGKTINFVADQDYDANDVVQLADGRAGVVTSAVASGEEVGVYVEGIHSVPKTASICFLQGGKCYWDNSASAAHFKPVADRDFFVGSVLEDAAASDTEVTVVLNVQPVYILDLQRDIGATIPVAGGISAMMGGAVQLKLASTSEAEKADLLTVRGLDIASQPIVEIMIDVHDGDASTAADFNVGLANATHATDADSITKHLFVHVDGNSTKLNFQSKDGTTTVAATDSTKVYVADAISEVWMDFRNPADVQCYVDGVNVLLSTVFNVAAMIGTTMYLLAHLEKTSSTDTFNAYLQAKVRTATSRAA